MRVVAVHLKKRIGGKQEKNNFVRSESPTCSESSWTELTDKTALEFGHRASLSFEWIVWEAERLLVFDVLRLYEMAISWNFISRENLFWDDNETTCLENSLKVSEPSSHIRMTKQRAPGSRVILKWVWWAFWSTLRESILQVDWFASAKLAELQSSWSLHPEGWLLDFEHRWLSLEPMSSKLMLGGVGRGPYSPKRMLISIEMQQWKLNRSLLMDHFGFPSSGPVGSGHKIPLKYSGNLCVWSATNIANLFAERKKLIFNADIFKEFQWHANDEFSFTLIYQHSNWCQCPIENHLLYKNFRF